MSSAPFVPVMNRVPFCTWAVVAAVAWATVKPSAAAASAPAASARDLPVAYMGESFRGEERRCCPPSAASATRGFCAPRPEVLLALG